MRTGITIQLFLLVISGVIIMTYIKPTFESMQATQDETQEYRDALDNASQFYEELDRINNDLNRIPSSDIAELDRYLPENVDPVEVMRDLDLIVERNAMTLVNMTSEEQSYQNSFTPGQGQQAQAGEGEGGAGIYATNFTLSVVGDYESFKQFLQDIERNAYPLTVTSLQFSTTESNFILYTLTVETYAFGPTSNPESE